MRERERESDDGVEAGKKGEKEKKSYYMHLFLSSFFSGSNLPTTVAVACMHTPHSRSLFSLLHSFIA